ncbi:MAG TPA: rhodanese-like domain-containing protein [Bacillales bacterium]|nr:rhodanese-like domain-containing protein [Bacillales bacterium]
MAIQEITPNEVRELLRAGKKVSIIDVREDEEVAAGKIPEAKHIPMGEIPDKLDELDKATEHILVCRSGNRSGRVTEFLQGQGYRVKNMSGGMLEWEGEVSTS